MEDWCMVEGGLGREGKWWAGKGTEKGRVGQARKRKKGREGNDRKGNENGLGRKR